MAEIVMDLVQTARDQAEDMGQNPLTCMAEDAALLRSLADEIERRGELLTHAWNGGEVQICETCSQWFRLEETISMDEGGWICKGCASASGSLNERIPEGSENGS